MNVARARMTMRTTVQRNTAAVDDWGGTGVPGWTDHVADVACLAAAQSSREVVGIGSTSDRPAAIVTLSSIRVIVPEGTDVLESDRLADITDRQGNVLFPGPFDIESLDRYPRSHKELLVKAAA